MTRRKLTSVSLFSGCGGLDAGLHLAGFRPLHCAELDPNARASLRAWLKQKRLSPGISEDVTSLNPSTLLEELGLRPGELDLLAGGPPCQAFSLIGKRESLSDLRGLLLFEMVRLAEVLKPRVVLIEQVKGLRSAPGFDGEPGGALATLVRRLKRIGYNVHHTVLRAADYGVPQLRERMFVVACKGNFEFPAPTHGPTTELVQPSLLQRDLEPYRTVGQVISDLPAPSRVGEPEVFPNHADITPVRDKARITGVPEGECLARQLHLPAEQRQRLDPEKDTTKFRRLAMNKPSLTLRGGEAFYHPTDNRYLTPREYLRIHSFDDDHLLVGPIRGRSGSFRSLDQHRQVANAVPPLLARAVGQAIADQLLRSKPVQKAS